MRYEDLGSAVESSDGKSFEMGDHETIITAAEKQLATDMERIPVEFRNVKELLNALEYSQL